MKIFDCEQGSDEWFACRMGMPTASEYHTVLATAKGGGPSETRKKYLYRLARELLGGKPVPTYANDDMARGRMMEPEAREAYAFETGLTLQRIGFVQNHGQTGASPDALIGKDGVLEIKTSFPDIVIAHRERGGFPPQFVAQCQGALWVTEREWVEIWVYPTEPIVAPYRYRAYRDVRMIKEIAGEVVRFNEELAAIVERNRPR